jgi:hypothetical protein
MKVVGQHEILLAHLYNPDALKQLPGAIRTAERLGYEVEIHVQYDGSHKVHSLQVFASKDEEKKS